MHLAIITAVACPRGKGVDNGGARGAEAPPDFSPLTMYNQGLVELWLNEPLA